MDYFTFILWSSCATKFQVNTICFYLLMTCSTRQSKFGLKWQVYMISCVNTYLGHALLCCLSLWLIFCCGLWSQDFSPSHAEDPGASIDLYLIVLKTTSLFFQTKYLGMLVSLHLAVLKTNGWTHFVIGENWCHFSDFDYLNLYYFRLLLTFAPTYVSINYLVCILVMCEFDGLLGQSIGKLKLRRICTPLN